MKQQPDESDKSDESVSDAASVCQDGANARRESHRSHRVISSHRHIPRLWPSGTSTGVLRHYGYCQISQVTGCGCERWDGAKHGAQWCPVGVQGLVRGLVSNGLDKFLRFPRPKSHRLCCFCTKDLKQDLNRVGMDQELYQKDSKFNTCQYVSIRKMCHTKQEQNLDPEVDQCKPCLGPPPAHRISRPWPVVRAWQIRAFHHRMSQNLASQDLMVPKDNENHSKKKLAPFFGTVYFHMFRFECVLFGALNVSTKFIWYGEQWWTCLKVLFHPGIQEYIAI